MRDSSILASLDELKAIHHQRIADEHAAIAREQAERTDAARKAAQARLDAEAAQVRQAHEAELRVHAAAAAAEREARLRIEAAASAEQARLDAELAAQRQIAELELRRETIHKQRPRWMIAVTAMAIVAAVALGAVAVGHQRAAELARERMATALAARTQATEDARVAKAELARIDDQLRQLQDEVTKAIARVDAATGAAARERELAGVRETQQKLAAAQRERAETKRRHDEAVRKQHINSDGCLGTALGCMDNP